MSKEKKKIATDLDNKKLDTNPFGNIDFSGLEVSEAKRVIEPPREENEVQSKKSRGRVDVRREKAGRGGKTVTTIEGIKMAPQDVQALLKGMKLHCGVGGAYKDGVMIIQGDKREEVGEFLEKKGFRVVFAGG